MLFRSNGAAKTSSIVTGWLVALRADVFSPTQCLLPAQDPGYSGTRGGLVWLFGLAGIVRCPLFFLGSARLSLSKPGAVFRIIEPARRLACSLPFIQWGWARDFPPSPHNSCDAGPLALNARETLCGLATKPRGAFETAKLVYLQPGKKPHESK